MPGKALNVLKPLEKCVIQPYFSNRLQLADIIDWVLRQIGPASMYVSTYSTSEAFLRRLYNFKKAGLITECCLFCDLRAARKTKSLYLLLKSVFDRVSLCENHSKVVLLQSASSSVAIITSQNQTRGDRYECGVITSDFDTLYSLIQGFHELSANSVSLYELLDISPNN